MRFQIVVIVLLLSMTACRKDDPGTEVVEGFESLPVAKQVNPGIIDEASGIADSKINQGYLWVQQDSGNPNEIALLSHDGSFLKTIAINAVVNRDWEDMALANGPVNGTNYIYLADIGDNSLAFSSYFIYRFAEPPAPATTVANVEKITFQYPDGPHDAEAIISR